MRSRYVTEPSKFCEVHQPLASPISDKRRCGFGSNVTNSYSRLSLWAPPPELDEDRQYIRLVHSNKSHRIDTIRLVDGANTPISIVRSHPWECAVDSAVKSPRLPLSELAMAPEVLCPLKLFHQTV